MSIDTKIHCALCNSTALINLGKVGIRDFSVTSDTQLCACTPDIYLCSNCNLLQKNYLEDQLALILNQYTRYTPHHLSDGREQLAFPVDGAPLPRTALALQQIKPLLPLSGRLLDFGTGNGTLLRSTAAQLTDWTFDAFDISNSLAEDVRSLPQLNNFFTGSIDNLPTEQYEFITLWHVLEHINTPVDALRRLGQCLTATGLILLQVPDVARNPFDLAVVDHSVHFSKAKLCDTVQAAGFEILLDGESWFHNCLTLLIRRSNEPLRPLSTAHNGDPANYVAWLKETCDSFEQIAAEGNYAIFGTGMASIWMSSQLSGKAACFVDEDRSKQGKSFLGTPILEPHQIPSGSNVLLPFLPEAGELIISKLAFTCRGKNIRFYKAPTY